MNLANLELHSVFARMIRRYNESLLAEYLSEFPAVALIGPRQVGKTTLALETADRYRSIYLDLESEADRIKLSNPVLYLAKHPDELLILDEVHRLPNLFQELKGLSINVGDKVSGTDHSCCQGLLLLIYCGSPENH
jgi:predicted AAA+ superfamily ATPase